MNFRYMFYSVIYMNVYAKEFKRSNLINSLNDKITGWDIKIVSSDYNFIIRNDVEFIRTCISAFSEIPLSNDSNDINFNNIFSGRIFEDGQKKLKELIENGSYFPFNVKVIMENYWIKIKSNKDILNFENYDKNIYYSPDYITKTKGGNFYVICYNGNCSYHVDFQIVPQILSEESNKKIKELEDIIEELKKDSWVNLEENDI